MGYQLIFTESYNKRAEKFLKKHPQLISVYKKSLTLLELNPQHPSLRLHRLKGKWQDLHSISINMSYRITFEFLILEKNIILVNIYLAPPQFAVFGIPSTGHLGLKNPLK